ncbi:251_t:CDS:1 [Dentiscutata erythropus]|uniref:251_t:CDS:1 n=1 Tax=Dentiscutata erythropus TaxID=1348616 RepID=A0A9N9JNI6_9GLOM|nr:251_t:CDS:1 [Dentiscutata erythropus]
MIESENAENINAENVEKATKDNERKYEGVKHLEFDIVYNKYVEKHNRIIAKLLNSSAKYNLSELPKVVVYQPDMINGFGNRFPGIVCSFLYSLITDRLFFIEGYNNFSDYHVKDFDHDWKILSNLYENSTSRHLHHENDYNDFQLVTRGNLSNEDKDILYVKTWDYACAPITSNPHYKRWFDKIIPDYRVFTAISLKLLSLHPNINKRVETFANNNFFTDYTIGIHLREKKRLAGMMAPVDHYIQVVKMLLIKMNNMNITIFVAADTNYGRENLVNSLRDVYNSNNNSSVKIVHTEEDLDAPNLINANTGSEVGALIDMKLLSLCDDLLITYGSSFGYTAAGWSQKASRQRGPFVVMPIKNSKDDLFVADKVWVTGTISCEPCMYLSKKLIHDEDEETVRIFKTNPLWIHYSQCHWLVF